MRRKLIPLPPVLCTKAVPLTLLSSEMLLLRLH